MKKFFIIAMLMVVALVCSIPALMQSQCPGVGNQKMLVIKWQHKSCQSANPCARCTMVPKEFKAGYDELSTALAKLDILVVLDNKDNDKEGDRILFNGKALEDLLDGRLVKRECTSCVGSGSKGKEYNVLAIDSTVYEITPASLIIKAGLLAASELFTVDATVPCGSGTPCQGCPGKQ